MSERVQVAEVTVQSLLMGSLFALEQCGRLLEDAVILFEHSRHASAAGVALLAREELGRYRILLDLWRKAAAGEQITVDRVFAACEDHVVKQKRAQLSLAHRADNNTQVGRLLKTRLESEAGTPEYDEAGVQLQPIYKRKWKAQPHERHQARMSAFYVDLTSDGASWARPSDLLPLRCAENIIDAISDYTIVRQRIEEPALLYDDHDLAAALATLPIAVALPCPRSNSPRLMAAMTTPNETEQ